MKSATLYYRHGGSDKVYQAGIEPRDDRFAVTFAYGRRGTTLKTGVKTPTPVDLQTAEHIFDKLVQEKTAKGYSPGEAGTPYKHTAMEGVATGILPQLLTPIDETEAVRLLSVLKWCLQEKMDGRRLLIRKDGKSVQGINRRGLVVSLPQNIHDAVASVEEEFTVDGECVGDTYYAFDVLERNGEKTARKPYETRWHEIGRLFSGNYACVKIVNTAFAAATKRNAFEALKREHAEGVVFKLQSARYSPGRPHIPGPALKFKFTATGSFIVEAINASRSVRLKLFGEKKSCGNVTIPPNHPIPEVGCVIEVQYLYAFLGGSLYQPVYRGVRDDIDPNACLIDQLKFKPEENDDDGE